jgi:RimJ/RimL family protein N-acetyltransferase
MFIRSERLFLRPGWPEDWAELLTAINNEHLVRNLATVPWPYTMDDAMAFAARGQERMLPHFFITLPTSDGAKLIGSIGLARDGDDVELGYWISHEHWGQGYATEAARAVLRLAATLGHSRIVAGHFTDNPASGRVLCKVGFVQSGELTSRISKARGGQAAYLPYELHLDAKAACSNENYSRAA